jgi:hypothetical protein
MKARLVILICLIAVFSQSAYASYTADCEGYNSETSSYVAGQCSDGSFEGYDSETGDFVYGGCSHGGELKAYDSETSAYVYGNCEGG